MSPETEPTDLSDPLWHQALHDGLPIATCLADLDGRLLHANARFNTWYGQDPGAIRGKTASDLWSPAHARHFETLDAAVVATGEETSSACAMSTIDGKTRDLCITKFPVRDVCGRIVAIGTTHTDISGMRPEPTLPAGATDVELRPASRDSRGGELSIGPAPSSPSQGCPDSEAGRVRGDSVRHLQQITDAIPVLIVHYDRALRYRLVNRTYCDWRCVSSADIVGRTVEEVVGPALYRRTRKDLERALKGQTHDFEYEATFPDGHSRVIRGQLIPERDAGNNVVGVFAVGTDISELRAMEGKLLRGERLAAIGKLAATVAHELRTPLGTVVASAQLLRRIVPSGRAESDRVLDRIERNVQRCTAIIREMLDYTRLSRPKMRPTRVDEWVASWLNDYEAPAGVDLERTLGSGAVASFDPGRLGQALRNLVDNAIQITREASLADVPVGVQVRTQVKESRIEVLVIDRGSGIPSDIEDLIFEPLFSTRAFGVGLGLPLVQQVMLEHAGGVEVHETGPEGTTMLIWLPVLEKPSQ